MIVEMDKLGNTLNGRCLVDKYINEEGQGCATKR